MTEQEVIERLRAAIEQAGSQQAFADAFGFTAGYVSDVLRGKRDLADRILAAIGVERVVTYQLANGAASGAQAQASGEVGQQNAE